jgi:hypothetical protein
VVHRVNAAFSIRIFVSYWTVHWQRYTTSL